MESFASQLLAWHKKHGRHDLPWQKPRTAYRVWLSEIMLQQTQVATVIPYFIKFIARFPELADLANAPQDDVLALWAGLGYYSRARNLHRSAQIIIEKYQGKFPEDLVELQTLPGIGRSTAGAILAQAFQKHAPILDGNVKRVLTRFYAIEGWPGTPSIEKKLWQLAEQLTPTENIVDYTQAIMDLGATLCSRSKPLCQECPLQKNCLAFAQNKTKELPTKNQKKALPTQEKFLLLCQDNHGKILLEKRPPFGIWGSLWCLPLTDKLDELPKILQKSYGVNVENYQLDKKFRHTFSHFHLEMTPVLVEVKNTTMMIQESDAAFLSKTQIAALGLPAPVQKVLAKL